MEVHYLPHGEDDGEQVDQRVGQGVPLKKGDGVDAAPLAGLVPEIRGGFAFDDVCDLVVGISIPGSTRTCPVPDHYSNVQCTRGGKAGKTYHDRNEPAYAAEAEHVGPGPDGARREHPPVECQQGEFDGGRREPVAILRDIVQLRQIRSDMAQLLDIGPARKTLPTLSAYDTACGLSAMTSFWGLPPTPPYIAPKVVKNTWGRKTMRLAVTR